MLHGEFWKIDNEIEILKTDEMNASTIAFSVYFIFLLYYVREYIH